MNAMTLPRLYESKTPGFVYDSEAMNFGETSSQSQNRMKDFLEYSDM